MAETVLLTCSDGRLLRQLQSWLVAAGFNICVVGDLDAAMARLQSQPKLIMFDLNGSPADRETLLRSADHCRRAEIPLLCYSSGEKPSEGLCAALFARKLRLIFDPWNRVEVQQQIAAELQISDLRRQQGLVEGRLRVKQQELADGLRSAELIQRSLLPETLPNDRRYRFAWRFRPCQQVGGDLFNVIQLDESIIMAYLFDVSGHGVSAAMVTVSVYQSLSLHTGSIVKQRTKTPPFYRIPEPDEVLAELETEYPFERFEKFFSISYLLLDRDSGRVRFSSGGHPPPVLVRRGGGVELLREGGALIGIGAPVPFETGETFLGAGDRLYLYSDGLVECVGATGEQFGAARLLELLESAGPFDLDASCERVMSSVVDFVRDRAVADDMTLLGIECRGGTGA